jgi:tetratricopeptide (TPR) repeat protein
MLTNLNSQLHGVSLDPSALESLYAAGHSFYQQQRFAEALPVFRVMLAAAPTDERGWLLLGECHEELGQEWIAREIFAAVMTAATPAPRCAIKLARLLRAEGETQSAQDALEYARDAAEEKSDNEAFAIAYRELQWAA